MAVDVGAAVGKVILDTVGVSKGVDAADEALGKLESGLDKTGKIAKGAATALVTSITAIAVSGTKMAIELEAQLDGVQAILGASADEMKALRAQTSQLGLDPKLKVTTADAAAAMEMLARNGLTATEIVGGATRATVLLANATGGDFAKAANIATDAMAAWGISADEMETAVNGISAVTARSKFTIDDYRLALGQAAGVAASSGVEFDDFNVVMAGISPLFRSGATAATSYKTMLQRLIPQSEEARVEMERLGFITADGANAFFTQSGAMRSMEEIAGILNGSLAGLSEQERLASLSIIFGTDAMNAAVGMAKMGADGYRDLASSMSEVNAEAQAGIRMDNTAGSIEIMLGVFDELKIKVGEVFSPSVRVLVDQLTESLITLNEQFDEGKVEKYGQALKAGVLGFFGGYEKEVEGVIAARLRDSRSMEDYMALVADLNAQKSNIDVIDVWGNDVLPTALDEIDRGLVKTAGSFDEYWEAVRKVNKETDLNIRYGNENKGVAMGHYKAVRMEISAQEELARREGEAAQLAEQHARVSEQAARATREQAGATEELAEANLVAEQAQAALTARMAEYFLDGLKNVDKAASLTDVITEQASAAGLTMEQTAGLLQITDETTQAHIEAATARAELAEITHDLAQQVASGAMSEEAAQEALHAAWVEREGAINAIADQAAAEEEAAQAAEELEQRYAELNQALDELNRSFTQSFMAMAENDGVLSLNEELMSQAQAAGASATEMALLGLSTGEMTESQVQAALKAAILKERIGDLATAYAEGGMSADQLVASARTLQSQLDEEFTLAFNEEGIDGVIAKGDEFIGKMEEATAAEYDIPLDVDTTVTDEKLTRVEERIAAMDTAAGGAGADTGGGEMGTELNNLPELATTAMAGVTGAVESGGQEAGAAAAAAGDLVSESMAAGVEQGVARAEAGMGQLPPVVSAGMGDAAGAAVGRTGAFVTVGRQISGGLAVGIVSGRGGVVNAVASVVNAAIAAANAAAQVHSPSRRTMELGEQIVQGLIVGIGSKNRELEEAGEDLLLPLDVLMDAAGTFYRVGSEAADRFSEQVLDPLDDSLKELDDRIGSRTKSLAEIIGVDPDQVDLTTAFYRTLAEGNDDVAYRIRELLRLQQERNEAEAAYEGQQERILALEQAKADLNFLQQQLDLLGLIREYDLNPGDILGGMALGLDASLPDMIEAMTAAMRQVVAAAKDELGIASPSRVFARIGEHMVAGVVNGITGAQKLAANAAALMASQATDAASISIGMNAAIPSSRPAPGAAVPAVAASGQYHFTQNIYPSTAPRASDLAGDWELFKAWVGG